VQSGGWPVTKFLTFTLNIIECMSLTINIDTDSGFCFGVTNAIKTAENELSVGEPLWCIGEIVHNEAEVDRLTSLGLQEISTRNLNLISHKKILIRAHGEPPATYITAANQHLKIIDATCPIVLKLQQRVAAATDEMRQEAGQVVIFGKRNHPEMKGLIGHASHQALIVEKAEETGAIDFTKPVRLFSQTTMDSTEYGKIKKIIEEKCLAHNNLNFETFDSVCKQVAGRKESLSGFAASHDLVLFVSGKNSSNGNILFKHCRTINPNTRLIEKPEDLQPDWFAGIQTVGISGATSTPGWLMDQVAATITKITEQCT
ncbi:MAG: 4-hydroxy-3-methylbut-2-enyl diphosphate reductase, partial [Bacteroidetes bacterium HGW-Bacteroidetes-22]